MHANTRQYTYFAFLLVDLSFVYIGPSWRIEVYMCALLQLCLTLCNPVDCSLPASSVRGILQARILEWVTIPFLQEAPVQTLGWRDPLEKEMVTHSRTLA